MIVQNGIHIHDVNAVGAITQWHVNFYTPSILIENSSFDMRSQYGAVMFMNYSFIKGAEEVSSTGSITLKNIEASPGGIFGMAMASYFEGGLTDIDSFTVDGFSMMEGYSAPIIGTTISTEADVRFNQLNISNIEGSGTSGEAYGLMLANDYRSKYDPTFANLGTVNISNITSTESQAFGIYNEGQTDENHTVKITLRSNNINVSNIEGINAGGYIGSKGSYLEAGRIDIESIIATQGEAVGFQTSETETKVNGDVTIDSIHGVNIANALSLSGGSISGQRLQISDVFTTSEDGRDILLDAQNAAAITFTGATLTPNTIDSNFEYLGQYAEAASEDIRSVQKMAVRSLSGSQVNLNDENGNYSIVGTVLAGRGTDDSSIAGGTINISGKQVNIYGDVFAGNGGQINLNLTGASSVIEGQIDDYHELNTVKAGEMFKNSAFYDDNGNELAVSSAGKVSLALNDNSKWIAHGQNFVSEVALNGGTIDLTKTDGPSSITAGTVSGKGNVIMNLNSAQKGNGDMLYATLGADEDFEIKVQVKWDENSGGYDALESGEKVRFATLNNAAASRITARTDGAGIFNLEYRVITDAYDADNTAENTMYNGADDGAGIYKPGADYTDAVFDANGTNYYIVKTESSEPSGPDDEPILPPVEELSKAGQTIVAMSKANYANAVYMDTLNKRQGEARYSMGRDNGVWVRMRHDNIGKEDAFRSHNTMFEMGYDVKDANSYGEFHTGVALDYLNGSIDYHNVNGDGDLQRYGLWFYTTFLGKEGQYADLVLKYGHLKNDFDVTSELNEQISGDYSNNVVSLSAETGWKFTHNTGFYIEPQVQLQYSYVTSADYTTSQNTQVELDSIHSLIGRAGFRAGKDFAAENPITAYIRGDVLHEFLGDQDIRAYDNTGVFDATYENDDTWYSAGVGLSVMTSQNTYFYIEGEQVFGADNDNTYTVSGGFKHSF